MLNVFSVVLLIRDNVHKEHKLLRMLTGGLAVNTTRSRANPSSGKEVELNQGPPNF